MKNDKLDVIVPSLGERIESAVVSCWHVEVGQQVAADELFYDLTTDKVEIEVPAPQGGKLLEQLATVGQQVKIGSVIARLEVC
ncbi:MAG: hypothetical protein HN353_07465 [Bdellovibrionales bacterium]|jgi:pyruvate/2-oxoglutarate dehydrogenase complex dihydrolipoamide acyltransferase (E2) component|nr:hypothetical protein [Bdellovibrionales bacterium]MBT3526649.1 hypothetical protein [Bdellovibrionales bacterium]MBT7668854.1 hypothetical protein [Bdellovibrionales bacterium]